jgi:hypothetical protein
LTILGCRVSTMASLAPARAALLLLVTAVSTIIHTTASTPPTPTGEVRPSNGSTAAPQYHRYIVVGAGPGGLQIAHYLASAGRDYIVLDGGGSAGSFFHTFPRFRQLISINKRATGRSELDFNLRHDWNSLLSEASHSVQGTGDELGGAAGTEGECELLVLWHFCAASPAWS